MGHKIFVSYKYADDQVANLAGQRNSSVRDYVDELESYFDSSSHIYKGNPAVRTFLSWRRKPFGLSFRTEFLIAP